MEPDDREYIGRLLMLGEPIDGDQWQDVRCEMHLAGKKISEDLSGADKRWMLPGRFVGCTGWVLSDAAKRWFAEGE